MMPYHFVFLAFALFIIKRKTRTSYKFIRPVEPFKKRIDKRGDWWFGASRSNSFGYHRGIDIETSGVFQPVISPFDGIITKVSNVYSTDSKYKYLEILGDPPNENYKVRLLYCRLLPYLSVGDFVKGGEQIGEMQDVSIKHNDGIKPPMLPHIHIEVIKNGIWIDPSNFFGISRNFV